MYISHREIQFCQLALVHYVKYLEKDLHQQDVATTIRRKELHAEAMDTLYELIRKMREIGIHPIKE